MINSLLSRMAADQRTLCAEADRFLKHTLNSNHMKSYLVTTWRKNQLMIHYKNDHGKRSRYTVDKDNFISKVNQYIAKGKTGEIQETCKTIE